MFEIKYDEHKLEITESKRNNDKEITKFSFVLQIKIADQESNQDLQGDRQLCPAGGSRGGGDSASYKLKRISR
jgi:hypothetical protein